MTVLRVFIQQLRDVISHFVAKEINLYIEVKHKIKDLFEVRWSYKRKLRKPFVFYSLCFNRLWRLRKLSLFHYYDYHYYVSVAFVLL